LVYTVAVVPQAGVSKQRPALGQGLCRAALAERAQPGVVLLHALGGPAVARVERRHQQSPDRELPAVALVAAGGGVFAEQLQRAVEVDAGLEMTALARGSFARERGELQRLEPLPRARKMERKQVRALGEPAAEAGRRRGDAPV